MKAAVVGVGAMGQHHARIYSEMNILDSICDLDMHKVSTLVAKYGGHGFELLSDLLNYPPDLVSIATPTPFHVRMAIQCMKAGCHVLLEKPISGDLESAKQLVNYANISNRVLAIGYVERFNPAFLALQDMVKDNKFGQLTSVSIKRVGGVPRSADNVILDLMTHDFNLLIALFNRKPEHVYVSKSKTDLILDSAQVLLDFGTVSATCEANWVSPIKIRHIHVTGTGGYCKVDLIEQKLVQLCASSGEITTQFNEEPLKNEISAFIEAVKTKDTSKIVSVNDALQTLILTLKAAGE